MNKNPNKLIHEQSPYLLQHAYNPVNWFPWGDDAFNQALKEDKPIFLSIGYSTCHWCHVMEHESFEDEEVAVLMNETFISIKVDREERPDIDNIYMTVCQMMTGGGGWPLSVIMTPSKKPFFSGTYFPKEDRYGKIGFKNLIKQIASAWKTQREKIINSANQITNHLIEYTYRIEETDISESIIHEAFNEYNKRYDVEYGGFGTSPKFPSPQNFLFLMRYWYLTKNETALEIVENTLTNIRNGGIFDQIGFGIHRYSTDKRWFLPHFEKMLYDQAMISIVFVEYFQLSGKELFRKAAENIFEYVLRDMQNFEGGFYSAEDADSEGVEGKFYVWSEEELKSALEIDEFKFFKKIFDIKNEGNYSEEATGNISGLNHLCLNKNEKVLIDPDMESSLNLIRKKLFDYRAKRIHPLKDDKILTDWNGLMIASLGKAARVLNDVKYSFAAEKAYHFIKKNLMDNNFNLYHRFRNNETAIEGNLDDYMFLIWGLLELYESTFNSEYLIDSLKLIENANSLFWDYNNGGYFFTKENNSDLIVRKKEIYDGAIPSGNSVAYHINLKLFKITSNRKYLEYSDKIIKLFASDIQKTPSAYGMLLAGYIGNFADNKEIIISGDLSDEEFQLFNYKYAPFDVMIKLEEKIVNEIEYLKNYNSTDMNLKVFICENFICNLPLTNIEEIKNFLLK